MGVPKNSVNFFGSSYNQDYSIWGVFILGNSHIITAYPQVPPI